MTTTLNQYDPRLFTELPHFEDNRHYASEATEVVNALGKILIRHDLHDHLGVCLLHKHFEISPDEVLVESVTEGGALITPRQSSTVGEVLPYMWRCVTNSEGTSWYPLEFVETSSISAELANFIREQFPQCGDFLRDAAAYLADSNMQHVFGIAVIHRQQIVIDHATQALLESDGRMGERALRVVAAPRPTLPDPDRTRTLWKFDASGNESATDCSGHGCAGHCGKHGTGGGGGECKHE